MSIDIFGCRVSLESEGSVASWNSTMLGILSHASSTPTHLADVLDEHPEFCIGSYYQGFILFIVGQIGIVITSEGVIIAFAIVIVSSKFM